jgi:G:T-mismatch repair DNA endonuclease (very short patch repair protein)
MAGGVDEALRAAGLDVLVIWECQADSGELAAVLEAFVWGV